MFFSSFIASIIAFSIAGGVSLASDTEDLLSTSLDASVTGEFEDQGRPLPAEISINTPDLLRRRLNIKAGKGDWFKLAQQGVVQQVGDGSSLRVRVQAMIDGVHPSSTVIIRAGLPQKIDRMWVVAARYSVPSSAVGNFSLQVVSLDYDENNERIQRETLWSRELSPGTKGYFSVNLGRKLNPRSVVGIMVSGTTDEAEGFVDLGSLHYLSKKNFLQPGVVLNFLNTLDFTPDQNAQLEQLYEVGHRVYIYLLPKTVKAASADIAKIRNHPTLKKATYLFAMRGLGGVGPCDKFFYSRPQKVQDIFNMFSARPIGVSREGAPFTPAVPTGFLMDNCANPEGKTARDISFKSNLDAFLSVVQSNRDLAAGIYMPDEIGGHAIPTYFQRSLHSYFSKTVPDLLVVGSHNDYIGGILSGLLPPGLIPNYYDAESLDVVLFDFYLNLALYSGNYTLKAQHLQKMERLGLLSKPWLQLFGTGTFHVEPEDPRSGLGCQAKANYDKALPVQLTGGGEANIFGLSEKSRANWTNIGFWAFMVSSDKTGSWNGTLAKVPTGFCLPQYQSVVEYSRNWRKNQLGN